ncbi:MAG: HD domain-containing protein [Candidatus Eremiobacterota bacterium]
MKINDRVYGTVDIDEPVLLKLIQSKPVQRLKGINQAGASQYAIPGKTVTRYEHSLGVMIFLGKIGASIEEQIAGLLHDTPHTAFSHVIDFVFQSEEHDFHEKFYEEIVLNSDIPDILKKYDFSVDTILDDSKFPLLEKTLPDLCADRIDYSLRDMVARYGYTEKIKEYLESFIVYDHEIIINDRLIAKRYSEDYLKMDDEVWSNPLEVALFYILAEAIKIALHSDILSEKDLFNDDNFVYEKLKDSGNKDILKRLSMISPSVSITDDSKNYDFYTKNKLRYVNPKCLYNQSIKRVSDFFPDFCLSLEKHNKWIERGFYIRIM